jgi:hypothetical protein
MNVQKRLTTNALAAINEIEELVATIESETEFVKASYYMKGHTQQILEKANELLNELYRLKDSL